MKDQAAESPTLTITS